MGRFTDIFYLIISNILISESTVVVIQEGSTHTSLYSGNINFKCDTFAWIRKDVRIQQCYIQSNNIDYLCNQRPFVRKVETNVNMNNNVATTNLTIVNVYRNSIDSDEGVWSFRCISPNDQIITTFEIKLYQKPRSLQCTKVFQAKGLTVTCSCIGIYPQANVYGQKNQLPGNTSSCQNVLDSTNLYYDSTCTLTFPTASLSIGKLEINMTVYPNVTALISDNSFGNSSILTLNLEIPKTRLTSCPAKDIIENMPFTCKCERSDVSDILTNTSWLINGTEYSSSSNTNSFLNNIASRYNTKYTCIAVNVLGWKSVPLIYTPSVLYGPDNVILTLDNTSLDQCDNNGVNISGTCTVSDTNPDSTMYIYVSNSPVTSQLKIATNAYRFSNGISESGIIYILCRAVNSVFEEISSEIIRSMTVKGPPEAPQISSVSGKITKTLTDGNQLQVTEGNTDIVCESKGGFPLYKNLTLVCGTNALNNEKRDTINMTLNVSRDMRGMNCTCVVWHESKCLHNFVTVTLKLRQGEENKVGAIIGGVIAAITGVVLIVALTVLIVKRRSKKLRRHLQEANAKKMQTYSNVQVSEDYINSDTQQYEIPCLTPYHTAHADVHTSSNIRHANLSANYSDTNILGGFIEHTFRQQQPGEKKKTKEGETDVNPETHNYEEIHDVNTVPYATSTCKELSKPELSASYVNLEIVQQASVL